MTVPVCLSTGFLESGKATLIKETLLDTGFNTGEYILLLVCEEGMEDYDDDFLTETNTVLAAVDNEAAVSYESLKKCDSLIEPNRVMIEFNGAWNLNSFIDVEYPLDWLLVQVLSIADVSMSEVYLNNMCSLIRDQLLYSETIIFNRCNEAAKRLYLGNNIEAISKGMQLTYKTRDGQIVEFGDDEMSFDPRADATCIADDDYGLWCMDVLEYSHKYKGKNVELKGKVTITHVDGTLNAFVFRRYAMVCHTDDTSLIGSLCHYEHANNPTPKDQVSITAQITAESDEEYWGDVPIPHVKQLTEVPPLDDELVYSSRVVIGNCLTCGYIGRTV